MVTPINPFTDEATGRILTEWFEYPEYTHDQIRLLAYESEGLDRIEGDLLYYGKVPDERGIVPRMRRAVAVHKNKKWVHNMSQQEVAMRMNEASKMIDPANMKFLDEEVQKRTGLQLNPLWQLECLVRSGFLGAKEQITVLKELAAYTHSKAPTLNHNANTNLSPEDFLLELAKSEYKELGSPGGPPLPQEKILFEKLLPVDKQLDTKMARKVRELGHISGVAIDMLNALEGEVDDDDMMGFHDHSDE